MKTHQQGKMIIMSKTIIKLMFSVVFIFAMMMGLSQGLMSVIKCRMTEILAVGW